MQESEFYHFCKQNMIESMLPILIILLPYLKYYCEKWTGVNSVSPLTRLRIGSKSFWEYTASFSWLFCKHKHSVCLQYNKIAVVMGLFINRTYMYLLHVTREFHSVKLICRNLYAIFSHVKKAYTANQNGV